MFMGRKKIYKLLAILLVIALCATGLPARNVLAEGNTETADSERPARPVITKIKNLRSTIEISWDEVEDVDYYCVYRNRHADTTT